MTTTTLSPAPKLQFFAADGTPLYGGKLYTYAAGTSTLLATFADSTGLTQNTNPVILDSRGEAGVWLDGVAYKFVLKTSTDTEIWTVDNITSLAAVQTYALTQVNAFKADLADTSDVAKGDALVGFKQANSGGVLSGAVARTVHQKLQEIVSVKDFGAVGDGITNDSAAIVAATATGRQVLFPAGTYLISSFVAISGVSNFEWCGEGADVTTIKVSSGTAFGAGPGYVSFSSCSNFRVTGLTFDGQNNASGLLTSHALPLMYVYQGLNVAVDYCDFTAFPYIGLALWQTQAFDVSNNGLAMTTPLNTRCYAINISCDITTQTGTIAGPGIVANNTCVGAGMGIAAFDVQISGNLCSSYKYGGGIATFDVPRSDASLDPNWRVGNYVVTDNICRYGTGVDSDGFEVCGMEIGGPYSTCANNVCYANAGQGIRWFGWQGLLANNICYNNGVAAGGTVTQAGIVAYQNVPTMLHYGCSYSQIIGNLCFDTGGGTQLYGYAENAAVTPLTGMTVVNNKVSESANNPPVLFNVMAGNSYDFDQWFTYTPTVASTTGSITTLGTVTGRYLLKGKTTFVRANVDITTNGTAAGGITVTLPSSTLNNSALGNAQLYGVETATSKAITGYAAYNSSTMTVKLYDGNHPVGSSGLLTISGFYVPA